MRRKHWQWLALSAAAASIAVTALYIVAINSVERQLVTQLRDHLSTSLDEALFSDQRGRVNDKISIAYVGRRINSTLPDWVVHRWYAPIELKSIEIRSVDTVPVSDSPMPARIEFNLPRNGRPRPIAIGYRREVQWPIFALFAAVVAASLFATLKSLPTSLTRLQIQWRRELAAYYGSERAHELVARCEDKNLILESAQRKIFDAVHKPDANNFHTALHAAHDARAVSLSELDFQWFSVGLDKSIEIAWRLATHAECVEIDLVAMQLRIRGCVVPISKTPLFYYAWYALRRSHTDGWVLNPPSNRPDREEGAILAKLMWRHKGHAKAIDELEEHGLRAKTLDQNRSKIKDEISAALGAELAERYLFDVEPDGHGRSRHRLRTESSLLRIVTADESSAESKQSA